MTRYRLRFLLQEFDLPRGSTLLGRSLDCHVTIEDPLVSRQHAQIVIDDDGARIEDLGSRNGVKVNGVNVRTLTPLKDGDRLRIGTQELVFCRVDPVGTMHAKTTGVLRLCANCRLPYPREMVSCPNCEGTEQTDEETLSGSFGGDNQHSWSVQLLIEALEKALLLNREADADRIVRRATAQVDELLVSGAILDGDQLASLARAAGRSAILADDAVWGEWVAHVYVRAARIPPGTVIDSLMALAQHFPSEMKGPVLKLAAHLRSTAVVRSAEDGEALARLEHLRRLLGGATPAHDPRREKADAHESDEPSPASAAQDQSPVSTPTLS